MNTHPDVARPSDPPVKMLHLADLASESVTAELATRLPALELQADQLVRGLTGGGVETERQTFESHRTSFEVGPPDPHGPRGPEAVLHVMHEQPGRLWKVIDLKRELLRRGWAPTPKAVEASVKRLRGAGKVELVSYGHYRLIEVEFGEMPADGPRAA